MSKKILIPISNGTEELEAVATIDLLRRANFDVVVAGQHDIITCSRGVKILPDILIDQLENDDEYDAIVIPGGVEGVENLSEIPVLSEIIAYHKAKRKLIAAVCAAPTLLDRHNILPKNARITSHPSVAPALADYAYSTEPVVTFENYVTSRGAGTAAEFALEIIRILHSPEKAMEIAKQTCMI